MGGGKIAYTRDADLYYLSNGKSVIKTFVHKNSERDDSLLLCPPSGEKYTLLQCAENTFQYQNFIFYAELNYDCHDESCKSLVEVMKSNYVEKRIFIFDNKTFALGDKWHLVTLAKFGISEFYSFFHEGQSHQSIVILRRKATQSDDVAYFLNNFGFTDFIHNEMIVDLLPQNGQNFYYQSSRGVDVLINIDILQNLNVYGTYASKENLRSMKELVDFLSQEFQKQKPVARPEFIKAQTVMGVDISDGYNSKYIEDIGLCNQYKTFDDYANFIKSNSRLDWKKVNYQGHEAIKADYKANDYPQQLMIYKMCLDKKSKSIYNLFQQQESQEAYDAIDEKLTEALK